MNLIIASEVLKYSSLDDHVNQAELEKFIPLVEQQLKMNYLCDLYPLLIADRVDLSCIEMWSVDTPYSQCDKVLFGGDYYESDINKNTSNPCEENWTIVKPFVNTCYNNLWENGLRDYLAYAVSGAAIPFLTYRVGSKGAVEFTEDDSGIRSASGGATNGIQKSYLATAASWLDIMKIYIKDNEDTCPDFTKVKTDYCGVGLQRKSRGLVARFGL